MARRNGVRLWASIAGVLGPLLAASPGVLCLIGQAVAQTSEQADDEAPVVDGIGDWILRLFRNSGEDTDESRSKRRDGDSKDGGNVGSGGGGGDDDGGGGDDGGGSDDGGGGDDGGEGGEGGDDD